MPVRRRRPFDRLEYSDAGVLDRLHRVGDDERAQGRTQNDHELPRLPDDADMAAHGHEATQHADQCYDKADSNCHVMFLASRRSINSATSTCANLIRPFGRDRSRPLRGWRASLPGKSRPWMRLARSLPPDQLRARRSSIVMLQLNQRGTVVAPTLATYSQISNRMPVWLRSTAAQPRVAMEAKAYLERIEKIKIDRRVPEGRSRLPLRHEGVRARAT